MEIVHYLTEDGVDLFQQWMDSLRDNHAKISILRRIDRSGMGNFGDCKVCRDGVSEMRVDVGPGYRVYYLQHGKQVIVLLCGGDKRTQNADINRAVACKADYLRRLRRNSYEHTP